MAFFSRKKKRDSKSEGEEHYTKGQWSLALEAYERAVEKDPDNVQILRRVADLRARLGRSKEAVEAYRKVANVYAETGFLVQAIAIYKILFRLDPAAGDVGQKLTELYARRGLTSRTEAGRRSLPETPLLSDLDPETFRQVVDRLAPRTLAMGERLFRQGDPGDSIFVVVSGVVRITRGSKVLAELGEGSFFGEGAFFTHEPRNADVVAVAPTELLEIRRSDMEDLMARYPGAASAMATFYRRRVLDGVLAFSPIFGMLPPEERKRVADEFQIIEVCAGGVVVREGDRDRALYLVKRGRFAVTTRPDADGETVQLAELGPGNLFGEVALVSRTPRTATVIALEAGEVLRAEGETLDPVLDAYPDVRRALEKARDERAADTVSTLLGRKG